MNRNIFNKKSQGLGEPSLNFGSLSLTWLTEILTVGNETAGLVI